MACLPTRLCWPSLFISTCMHMHLCRKQCDTSPSMDISILVPFSLFCIHFSPKDTRRVMADKTTSLSSETSHTGLISEELSTQSRDTTKQLGSWRFTVRAGVAVASVVFLLNLGTLIWALTLDGKDGSATVFEGKKPSPCCWNFPTLESSSSSHKSVE
jgi:hypothetical protein